MKVFSWLFQRGLTIGPNSPIFNINNPGSGNVIVLGQTPQVRVPVPNVQAPIDYVDRPEQTHPILARLLSAKAPPGRSNVSVIHGLGGSGKTTIARWLVWQLEVDRHFRDGRIWVTLGNEPIDVLGILNDWLSKLESDSQARPTLQAALSDLAAFLKDRAVLFVIDDVWPGNSTNVAESLIVPSPDCHFLLTTRLSGLARDLKAADFPLDDMSVDQATELVTYMLMRSLEASEQPLLEKLHESVGGNPLALELAALQIKQRRSWDTLLSDLSTEIANLGILDKESFNVLESSQHNEENKERKKQSSIRASLLLSVRSLDNFSRKLFAWLGVIVGHSNISARMAVTLWTISEENTSGYLSSLSDVGILKSEGDLYRMHGLMHDLAREILSAPIIPARETNISGLGITLQEASQQLLERYRAKTSNGLWHTLPEDGYIHDHLVQHFEQANGEIELQSLLWEESADGHCGWYWARERLGQTSGFIADVSRVWSYADRTVAAAATDGNRAQEIALQLHCALIMASLNSVSNGMPIEVLAGAVRYRLIAFPTALTLARQHPDARSRFLALDALAGEMPPQAQPSVLGEAVSAARGIDEANVRAWALAKVAPRLPADAQPSVLGEAVSAARGIDDAGVRDEALAKLAPRLPPEEALVLARSIDNAWRRDGALAAVAPLLPAEEALVLARSINDAEWRARALAEVAPRLPAGVQLVVLGEALSAARGIDDAGSRAPTLAELAPRLPADAQPSVLGEALSAARSINDAEWRARALAEVAPRLPAEAQPNALGEALSAARGIGDASNRAWALAELAPRLPAEAQPRVLGEAVSTARGIDGAYGAWWRGRTLAGLAPRLPPEEALVLVRGIDHVLWHAQALAEVAPRLPPEEAVVLARSINDAEWRARALAEVAPRLPAEAQPSVLGEALSAARGVHDAGPRAYALAAVAPWLPLEEALVLARSIDDALWRARALAAVAPLLPAEAQPGVLDEAVSAAHGIDDARDRAWALAEMAPRLPAEAQKNALGEALSAAHGIDDARWRARALAEVAPQLPADAQPSVLGEAVSTARGIDDAQWRAQALAEVAPRLPAEEALVLARSIDDVQWRARALAEVAPRLPAEAQVLGEALSAATDIGNLGWRGEALAKLAPLLPPEEALVLARGIDDARWRAPALAEVAPRLPAEAQPSVLGEAFNAARSVHDPESRTSALAAAVSLLLSMGQITNFSSHQWIETVRVLAMNTRAECFLDFSAILPIIYAFGGKTTIRNLGRSIISAGFWWPSLLHEWPASGILEEMKFGRTYD